MKNKIILTIIILSMIALVFSGCGGGGTTPPIIPETYIITASAGPHGSISPSGNVTVNQGSDQSFTITSNTGYQMDDVLVDGSSVGAVSSYTFTNVTEDHTISAIFSLSTAAGLVHNLTKDTYYDTIQAALDDADNDNTIEVADGIYDESIFFPSSKKIILQNINGASSTIIRGYDGLATVTLDGSLEGTTLEGFTITHTNGQSGRGIYIFDGNLSIENCNITDNTVSSAYDNGCGILNDNSIVTIIESTISGNTAKYGGGIYNNGTLNIITSTITNNSADSWGGGICNTCNDSLNIIASTISSNTATIGGGISNEGSITITESTISNNSGLIGGGIYNYHGGSFCNEGSITITGSTISGNSAGWGGGIENDGNLKINIGSAVSDNIGGGINNHGSLDIAGSIISDNEVGNDGGGIYISSRSGTIIIGGNSNAKKNIICRNYKEGDSPSLDQQIRGDSGNLYDTYKNTNYISVYCD